MMINICFIAGVLLSLIKSDLRLYRPLTQFLTIWILFCIGLKGGAPLVEHLGASSSQFSTTLTCLIVWGALQPILSFYLLKRFTPVDPMTGAAISASFGSVSVMTFVTALTFLDQQQIPYQEFIIPALAIMEIPAIISGIFLAKRFCRSSSLSGIFRHSLLNKAIITIFLGLVVSAVIPTAITASLLLPFKPLLALFLFEMGLQVGRQKHYFRSLSWSLNFFALYMPLIGALVGLLLSYLLQLDIGTGTLVAVLSASASYIAVPAAMKIALPQAKEGIYLPLSIGIAFPFNIMFGIPIYYYFAQKLLL